MLRVRRRQIGPCNNQRSHDVYVTFRSGEHQGRPSVFVFGINLGAGIKQRLYRFLIIGARGCHQGGASTFVFQVNFRPTVD